VHLPSPLQQLVAPSGAARPALLKEQRRQHLTEDAVPADLPLPLGGEAGGDPGALPETTKRESRRIGGSHSGDLAVGKEVGILREQRMVAVDRCTAAPRKRLSPALVLPVAAAAPPGLCGVSPVTAGLPISRAGLNLKLEVPDSGSRGHHGTIVGDRNRPARSLGGRSISCS